MMSLSDDEDDDDEDNDMSDRKGRRVGCDGDRSWSFSESGHVIVLVIVVLVVRERHHGWSAEGGRGRRERRGNVGRVSIVTCGLLSVY
jgi:hypothetical protein